MVKCPSCGFQNSLQISVFQRYVHVFWIPTFPIGKTGYTQCVYCKQVMTQKEMPASLQMTYKEAARCTKTPIWMFSGLILAVLMVLATVMASV